MTEEKTVRVGRHYRVIYQQVVTFVCHRCLQTSFRSQYPGRSPKWCDTCLPEVKREQARERKRRQYQREREHPT